MNMLMNNYLCSDIKLFFLVSLTRNRVINKSVMPWIREICASDNEAE